MTCPVLGYFHIQFLHSLSMLLEHLVPELLTVSVKCYHLLVFSFESSVVCCIQILCVALFPGLCSESWHLQKLNKYLVMRLAYTLLKMKWAEHTKFLAHLAVFSLSVCTAHQLVYCVHQLSTPVTIRCAPTTICVSAGVHQPLFMKWLYIAHFTMQVCIDHCTESGQCTFHDGGVHQPPGRTVCSTLNSANVLSIPYMKCSVHTM